MTTYDERLSQYIQDLFVKQDEILSQIQENIPREGLPAISVLPEEGLFLHFLLRAIGARKVVEIGTLGGYSGIWLARSLPPEGKLITLEKDPQHAAIALGHFQLAGLQDIVEIRVGVALEILQQMVNEGPFDFVFIDADKSGYADYLDWAIENLRSGGIVAAHNAFSGGSIINPIVHDATALDIRLFNERAANEPRLISTIFPAGDGTLIGLKVR